MNQASRKYVFLLGANDMRTAKISGFDASRKVAYDWDGHNEFAQHLKLPDADKEFWYLLWFAPDAVPISEPVIVINTMTNPDILQQALARASNVVRNVASHWPRTVFFNRPDNILKTARDRIYGSYKELAGIIVPKTIRIKPSRIRDIVNATAREGLNYPYIVRPAGGHGGENMLLVQNTDDLGLLERFAFDGRDYYMTQFYDYRGSDGLYTKTRFIMLGGKLYPRHSITSDQWSVHARSRNFMLDRPDLKKREENTLANIFSLIAPETQKSILAITNDLQLDYVGFDVCILADGRLLVFEINASQNGMAPSDYVAFPYLESYVQSMVEGFNTHVMAVCNAERLVRAHA